MSRQPPGATGGADDGGRDPAPVPRETPATRAAPARPAGTAGAAALRVTADTAAVPVAPGTATSTTVRVTARAEHPVDVVLDVLGGHGRWCTVTPERVRLAPGAQAQVTLHVRLPATALDAATAVVGVRARAPGTGVLPHVAEVALRPQVSADVQVDLVPAVQRASGRARFTAVVRNDGGAPVRVRLEPGTFDPDVDVRVRKAVLDVPPRGRARAPVVVRGPAPWSGGEPERQFTVRAAAGDATSEALGALIIRTRVGTALLGLAGLLVLVAVVLLALALGGG